MTCPTKDKMTIILNRKSNRLKEWDYSKTGFYYITLCTINKEQFFGDIEQNVMVLNDHGNIVETCINEIQIKYSNIELNSYIIMPNHVHCIINIMPDVGAIHESPVSCSKYRDNQKQIDKSIQAIRESPLQIKRRKMTISKIVGFIKMQSAKQINILRNTPGKHLWQRNYYDHIIRNDTSLRNIREYIINNPSTWNQDEDNPAKWAENIKNT